MCPNPLKVAWSVLTGRSLLSGYSIERGIIEPFRSGFFWRWKLGAGDIKFIVSSRALIFLIKKLKSSRK